MRLLCHVLACLLLATTARAEAPARTPILTYHRFHPTIAGAATVVTTPLFIRQMEVIAALGRPVIPLRTLLGGAAVPKGAVVITDDDGFRSAYTEMFPVLRRFGFHATLFINPPAIGGGAYLTWPQLAEMQASGLVDIQPHTLTHPNFRAEQARRTPADFTAFVARELGGSRAMLQSRLGVAADILAWPYGIHDPTLEEAARAAGYVAAVALGGRAAVADSPAFALPRYQVYETDEPARFRLILDGVARR